MSLSAELTQTLPAGLLQVNPARSDSRQARVRGI